MEIRERLAEPKRDLSFTEPRFSQPLPMGTVHLEPTCALGGNRGCGTRVCLKHTPRKKKKIKKSLQAKQKCLEGKQSLLGCRLRKNERQPGNRSCERKTSASLGTPPAPSSAPPLGAWDLTSRSPSVGRFPKSGDETRPFFLGSPLTKGCPFSDPPLKVTDF